MKGELITFNLHTVLYIQAMQSPQQIMIHCKESYFNELSSMKYDFSFNCGEYNVIVDDVDNLDDEQLCSHYGINYDQVNCIEAM